MRRNHKTFKNKRLAWSISSAIALSVACGAEASEKPLDLEIKGQEIGNALMELGERAGVQIILPQDMGLSVNSQRVQGEYTLRTALDAMLEGSGLTYEFVTEDSVLIKAEDVDAAGAEEEDIDEEVVVTGTRLRGVAPASPVTVITREDIDKRGFNSVEDILRSLPQNVSTFNSSSHADGTAPRNSEGAVVANLRGLGIGATLILVNGRRTSASPAENLTFTDISTIPFGAIERVEILPDGGSAVYGADAVAGVINFIMKKDYQGAETRLRYENSSADADSYVLEQLVGFSWDSGNFTGSLRYQDSDPTTPSGAGITTLDQRSRGGRDFRNAFSNGALFGFNIPGDPNPAPGFPFPSSPDNTRLAALPSGDGTNVTVGDLVYVSEADFESQTGNYNALRPSEGALTDTLSPESTNLSGSFDLGQDLSDNIRLVVSGTYGKRETTVQRSAYNNTDFSVPDSNIYNNFGQSVRVGYDFSNEIANGLVVGPSNRTEATRYGINAGLEITLPFRDWQAKVDVGYSEDVTKNSERGLNTIGLDSSGLGADSFNAMQALIGSSLNLFGDGSVQVSAEELAAAVYDRPATTRTSTVEFFEATANGSLFDLPGGELSAVIGAEYRKDDLDFTDFRFPFSFEGLLGVPGPEIVPERTLNAAFFEVGVPIVGSENSLPGIEELSLTVQGRYESYDIEGPFGVTNFDFATFQPIFPGISSREYSKFSPRVGLIWRPIDDLKLRGTWSEGFQSPTLPELFTPASGVPRLGRDPLLPFVPGNPAAQTNFVLNIFGGNADLQPQESETITIGFDYTPSALPGLTVSATWQESEFNGQIGIPSNSLGEAFFAFPEVFSDLIGTVQLDILPFPITTINSQFGNTASTESEVVDFDISYAFGNNFGEFSVGLTGTYTSSTIFRVTADQFLAELPPEAVETLTQNIDATNFGPDRWKTNGYVDWSKDQWNANVFVRHSSNYSNFPGFGIVAAANPLGETNTTGSVASYTTVDTQITHTGDSGWKLGLGVRNLFDKEFPFVNIQFGADSSRVDFRRRVVYFTASKEFNL